jgi:predicted GIY-YIG superfamily endonuclease
MIEETIQINKLNLQFENKFNDEYFLLINGIDNFLFEEKIYISNYGEVYNKSQSRLFDYENSTLNLRVINGGTKGFSRWNLTTNSFSMSNTEYESRRRLKKISYGYNIQNSKKDKIKKIYNTNTVIDNKKDDNKSTINNYSKLKENVSDIELNNLELELYKYKFVYNEILNQKTNLEIKIKDIENKIQLNKKINDNKYKNTIIYMIRPKHNNFYMYIGHTIDKERRLKEHKRSTENDNKKIYKTIRETGGWEHWELIELASYVCECREDALKIEQEWCEKLRPNLNSNSPFA